MFQAFDPPCGRGRSRLLSAYFLVLAASFLTLLASSASAQVTLHVSQIPTLAQRCTSAPTGPTKLAPRLRPNLPAPRSLSKCLLWGIPRLSCGWTISAPSTAARRAADE